VAFYPNERLDTPDARSLDGFGLNDWTLFLAGFFADQPYVLDGFDIVNYSSIFATSGFELKLDNVVMFIPIGDEPGFYVFAGTEQDEAVSLSPNSINFVEAEFEVIAGVPDVRAFWDTAANENEGGEFTDTVDTVLNLNLKITSNITGFTAGKVPLYRVVTDGNNITTSVTDSRELFWRLGTGGSSPDPDNTFDFPDLPDVTHERLETPVTSTGFTATNAPWQGGDKNFKTFKHWADVVMTLFKETNAVPYWYMAGPAGGIAGAYQNAALTLLNGGTWQHSESTLGTLTLSGGSTIVRLGRSDTATLAAFTDLDLDIQSPNTLFIILNTDNTSTTYGMGEDAATPVLVGNVTGSTVTTITIGTNRNFIEAGGNLLVRGQQFSYTSYTPGTGVFSGVAPDPSGLVQVGDHTYQDQNGATGFYHFGLNTEVPGLASGGVSEAAERTVWLTYWDGSVMRVKNGDLEQGEQIQVGDETPLQVISYTGMTNEADALPDFSANGSPERFLIDDTDDLTDASAILDAELDKYTDQLRLVEKAGTTRAIVTGADKILRDNTTLSVEIKNLLMSFDGAEIDFDDGTIYESDGSTPRGSFTPATIAANQWRWYAISVFPTTITSDNKYEIDFTVHPGSADGASKAAAIRAKFATGAIRLGQIAVQEDGAGSVENVVQANIVQIGLSGEEDKDVTEDKKVTVYDPISTTLPTGASIDGHTLAVDDTALFSNLSSGDNQVYKVISLGPTAWQVENFFEGASVPTESDKVLFINGDDFAQQTATFDGTEWFVGKVTRRFVEPGTNGDEFVEEEFIAPFTLTGSATDTVESNLSFDGSVVKSQKIDYQIDDGTDRRCGTLHVTVNVAVDDAQVVDNSVETGDVGVFWDAQMNASTVEVIYTTTAGDKTMKADVKRFR
jgi:hypothetical protein